MAQVLSSRYKRRKSSFVFPSEPESERGDFLHFIEKSAAGDVLHSCIEALYQAKNQPEDPIHWIRNHLREKAPRRTQELQEIITFLTEQIIDLETEVRSFLYNYTNKF